MTEDFKEQLLNYLTGNLDIQTPSNNLNYTETETITNNLNTYIQGEINENYSITNLVQSKTNENILLSILGATSKRHYLVILDNTFTPVALISQFTSGVDFRRIMYIGVEEDGYFYAIESDTTTTTSGGRTYYPNKRFLMLNNITTPNLNGDYVVKIRKSYSVPNTTQLYYAYSVLKSKKSVGRSLYGFFYTTNYSTSPAIRYYTTKITVNVGIENEWSDTYLQTYTSSWGGFGNTANIEFDTSDGILLNDILTTQNYIFIYSLAGGTETLTTKDNIYMNSNIQAWYIANMVKSNLYAYTLILGEYTTGVGLTVLLINLQNNTITEIYDEISNNYYAGMANYIWSFAYEGECYFSTLVCNDNVNNTYEIKVGRIVDNNVYFNILKDDVPLSEANISIFLVTKNFNLYRYFVRYLQDSVITCKEIYNSSGYNGTEYIDINVLVPELGTIYSNNSLIYARTLYNKQVNGNTTVSTVEIPNNYLNDIGLQPKNLYSETNLLMNTDSTEFTKNIYETVDLNFLNTISMINDDTQVINNVGASRINNSISQETDYSNAYAGKIRINYTDNTSDIQSVNIPTITNGIATYKISIYVYKSINNIEIISNDENTIYNTITGTFEIGKYYSITQDVRVE